MRYRLLAFGIVGLAGAALAWSQDEGKSSTRDMFFGGLQKVTARKNRPAATGQMQPVAVQTPLGVRYSVLRYTGQDPAEVSPKTPFRSGDRIRLKVQVNDDGYLYLVHQGTSGGWQMMYPPPRTPKGGNLVLAGREYMIPETLMRFGGGRGIEKLFLIVSRVPEQKLEDLIFTLREDSAAPAPAPGAGQTLMAANRPIDNPLIREMRTSYTRDLVFDDAGEGAGKPDRGEAAVFVVNTSNKPDSRVVIDIALIHE